MGCEQPTPCPNIEKADKCIVTGPLILGNRYYISNSRFSIIQKELNAPSGDSRFEIYDKESKILTAELNFITRKYVNIDFLISGDYLCIELSGLVPIGAVYTIRYKGTKGILAPLLVLGGIVGLAYLIAKSRK